MIDLLTVGESRQMTAVAEKIRTALLTAGDIYLLSTFRLPPKQGGVLFGLYSRQDNTRWLEASVVGKINKGDCWASPFLQWCPLSTFSHPHPCIPLNSPGAPWTHQAVLRHRGWGGAPGSGCLEVPQKARYPNSRVRPNVCMEWMLHLGRGGLSLCPSKGVKQSSRSLARFGGCKTSCHPSRGQSDLMPLTSKKVLVFEPV